MVQELRVFTFKFSNEFKISKYITIFFKNIIRRPICKFWKYTNLRFEMRSRHTLRIWCDGFLSKVT